MGLFKGDKKTTKNDWYFVEYEETEETPSKIRQWYGGGETKKTSKLKPGKFWDDAKKIPWNIR